MNKVFTREWLRAAGIRALKTTAQSALAMIGTASAVGEVELRSVAAAALLSGLLSLLTSLAGLPECR